MTTRTRLTTLSAVAAAAALAVLGVATAQTSGTATAAAAEPTIEIQMVTPAADTATPAAPMAESAVQPMAAPVAQPAPQRIVIIADPEPVAEPAGLTAPLDRAGVQAEFMAMRDAGVLVPAGEAGDTEATAQRRLDYHQGQADAWTGYQLKLAEVRLARELAWAQQALEEQARAEEAARMQSQMQSQTQVAPAVEPPMEAPPTTIRN
jgi:hypothetical protein